MDETYPGVQEESPTSDQAESSESAPSAQRGLSQHVPYERFKEVNDERREVLAQLAQLQGRAASAEAQVAQARQIFQQIQQAQQRQAQGGQPLSQEEQLAANAMARIMENHPRFQQLMRMAEQYPSMLQGYQTAQQVQASQVSQIIGSGQQALAGYAQQAGMQLDQQTFQDLENMVAGVIRGNPEAHARFRSGDPAIVPWAFQTVYGQAQALARQQYASQARAKGNVRNLPPSPRGGPPGQPAPPKLIPGREREYQTQLGKLAEAMLANSQG